MMAQRLPINILQTYARFMGISWRPTASHLSRRSYYSWKHTSQKLKIISWRRPLIISSLTLSFFKSRKGVPSVNVNPILPNNTPIEISRIMLPDDTNPMGNVHGGTILKLIEQAGHVVSSRHCNRRKEEGDPPITTVLARVEKMDFHEPMLVGEIAQLQAAVTYTSPHSLEVTVDVWAENVISGERRHTNTAYLWYVAIRSDCNTENISTRPTNIYNLKRLVTSIPQLEGVSEASIKAGEMRYQAQRKSREKNSAHHSKAPPPTHTYHYPDAVGEHTVMASQTTLANIVLPSDCAVTGHMMGGALMKMMDNAAGICAARHCRSRVVTASIDVIDFHEPITNGEMVFVTARITFVSNKSMEIEVTTEAEGLMAGSRRITNTAYFIFVSLGEGERAVAVPPLKLEGEEERARFEEGRKRYLERRATRLEASKKKQ